MTDLQNQDIVCIAGVDFEPLWARTQQIVWRMPESNRILYVETPVSILSPLKDSALWYKWNLWRKGARGKKHNLYLYSPPPLLPLANRYRIFNKINQKILAFSLKKVCKKLGFKEPVLMTYLPNTVDLPELPRQKLLVYDCVDEHSAFLGFDPKLVKEMETALIKKSDLVLVTAQPLYDDKSRYTDEIYMVRNAADVPHFQKADDPATPVADDIKDIKGPVLGFIGRIKEWIDLSLIKEVALSRPDWSIIMVGPVEIDVDISDFNDIKNVHFVGSRVKEDLPGYLKKFDVCLNPFRESKLSYAVNPLKFYEYLASGRPVVSTPMPEMDMLKGLVEIGQGKDGFIRAIERALNDTPEKKQSRLNFAAENSWENRIEEISKLMTEKLNRL